MDGTVAFTAVSALDSLGRVLGALATALIDVPMVSIVRHLQAARAPTPSESPNTVTQAAETITR